MAVSTGRTAWSKCWVDVSDCCHGSGNAARAEQGVGTRPFNGMCAILSTLFQLILPGLLSMQFVWPPALPPQLAREQLSAGLWPNNPGTGEQWDMEWDLCSRRMTNALLRWETLIPVGCPHDLSASILQKVRNTWIIYLLWLHWNCNKTEL